MTGVASVLIGAVVLLLLIFVWLSGSVKSRKLSSPWDPTPADQSESAETCPTEVVERIFSEADQKFILRLKSPHLERLFRRERNAVAHMWVRHTSAAISRIMRRHLETSRQSEDLEFATEAGIFLRYLELKLICGTLFAAIELADPWKVRGLAIRADRLTQSIGDLQRALAAATQTRELSRAERR